jgi:DNA-binding MarR family transcriptional regulator
MSAGDLAEQTGLTGAAVTALIDRLENAGYVIRERGTDDRRRVTVHAVPEKLREVERLYEGKGASMSKLLAKYSPEEFSVIADFLKAHRTGSRRGSKEASGEGEGTAWQLLCRSARDQRCRL